MSALPEPSRIATLKETPLWLYGFPYDMHVAFKVARQRKPKGRKGYPPLKDEWDIDRDFDAKLAVEQTESPYGLQYGSKEGGRGIAVLRWARAFLRYKTGDESIVDNLKSVHSGLTGATKLSMNIIRIATARAWNLKDLDIEKFRAAGELPEEKVLTILQKYLGEPRWYLDWHYVTRNNLHPSLQSGAFQALVGIAVNFDPAGASDNEQAPPSMDAVEATSDSEGAEEERCRQFVKLAIVE